MSSPARKAKSSSSVAPLAATRHVKVDVGSARADQLCLDLQLTNVDDIAQAKFTGVGGTALLKMLAAWRPKLKGALKDVELPIGSSSVDLMMRELLLKARGEWVFPYGEDELCHCRAVPTAKVDAAIVAGCHSGKAVARETSAGTSCGTCLRDTQAIIDYRLKI